MAYNVAERVCLIENYFRSGSYSIAKSALFQLNPSAPVPHDSTIKRLVDKFRETGSVHDRRRSGRPSFDDEDVAAVQGALINSPQKSLRKVSQQIDMSYSSVQKICRKVLHLFPYKTCVMHTLMQNDYEQRSIFCDWLIAVTNDDPQFLKTCFWSDEAWFHLSGYMNSQNTRCWLSENPHQYVETSLHPQKIGVWAAMSGERIHFSFFEGRVDSDKYCSFIDQFAVTLTENERHIAWFQQDNATAHTSRRTTQHLTQIFGKRLIDKQLFPARSPDLTPMDFFLWGYVKDKVFANNPKSLNDLQSAITSCIKSVNSDMLMNVSSNIVKRAHYCKSQKGGHFQHLL